MTLDRAEAEDRLELAEARRLAADDAFDLLRRLAVSKQADAAEVVDAEQLLLAAVRATERAYADVAEVASAEIAAALEAIGLDGADGYRVAVRVRCGWSPDPGRPRCPRTAGRVLVVDRDRWLWVPSGSDPCEILQGESSDAILQGSCSRHGAVPVGELLRAVVPTARRHRNRWPIVR